MKRFNVATKKLVDGREKPIWRTVGTLTQFDDEGYALELDMFPETKFYVFPQKERQKAETKDNLPV